MIAILKGAGSRRLDSATAYRCQAPSTPLSWRLPRSWNRSPDPATKSFTVCETRISDGLARAATRAATFTAIPETYVLQNWALQTYLTPDSHSQLAAQGTFPHAGPGA